MDGYKRKKYKGAKKKITAAIAAACAFFFAAAAFGGCEKKDTSEAEANNLPVLRIAATIILRIFISAKPAISRESMWNLPRKHADAWGISRNS